MVEMISFPKNSSSYKDSKSPFCMVIPAILITDTGFYLNNVSVHCIKWPFDGLQQWNYTGLMEIMNS